MLKRPLSLLSCTLLFSSAAFAQENKPGIQVIDPDKKVAKANPAAIDTEHFEIGAFVGLLSVEDFNTNPSYGLALRYYFSEKYLLEGYVGQSSTKRSHSEQNQDFLSDRDFNYVGLAGGYQFLKGRSFLGKNRKYNTGLYILGGIEQVDFGGESNTGVMIGLSYKTTLTDWLNINVDFRDHIVNREVFGDDKMSQNTELLLGISTFF